MKPSGRVHIRPAHAGAIRMIRGPAGASNSLQSRKRNKREWPSPCHSWRSPQVWHRPAAGQKRSADRTVRCRGCQSVATPGAKLTPGTTPRAGERATSPAARFVRPPGRCRARHCRRPSDAEPTAPRSYLSPPEFSDCRGAAACARAAGLAAHADSALSMLTDSLGWPAIPGCSIAHASRPECVSPSPAPSKERGFPRDQNPARNWSVLFCPSRLASIVPASGVPGAVEPPLPSGSAFLSASASAHAS